MVAVCVEAMHGEKQSKGQLLTGSCIAVFHDYLIFLFLIAGCSLPSAKKGGDSNSIKQLAALFHINH